MGGLHSHSQLIDIYAFAPQLGSRHVNFLHQFLMRLRDIVERKDPPSQLEEEICSK